MLGEETHIGCWEWSGAFARQSRWKVNHACSVWIVICRLFTEIWESSEKKSSGPVYQSAYVQTWCCLSLGDKSPSLIMASCNSLPVSILDRQQTQQKWTSVSMCDFKWIFVCQCVCLKLTVCLYVCFYLAHCQSHHMWRSVLRRYIKILWYLLWLIFCFWCVFSTKKRLYYLVINLL